MTPLEQLQQMIRKLSPEELADLRAWIGDQDWAAWDRQVEADAGAGNLDGLAKEAIEDHRSGRTRPL